MTEMLFLLALLIGPVLLTRLCWLNSMTKNPAMANEPALGLNPS